MAPKAAAIRKKYAGRDDPATRQKMQEETMALYQEHGYSPMGGCLPMLIQFPIIMALYYVIVYPLQYICLLGKNVIAQLIVDFNNAGLLSVLEGKFFFKLQPGLCNKIKASNADILDDSAELPMGL